MKTIEITLYSFNELSEEAKETAIQNLYDINVDYEWWDYAYEDAKKIGIKITSFNIDRGNRITGDEIWSVPDIAEAILENHGESCETYKIAKAFQEEHKAFLKAIDEEEDDSKVYDIESDFEEVEDEFVRAILEEYLSMLKKEYEYLTSEEGIIETIKANGYDFTEDGEIYR